MKGYFDIHYHLLPGIDDGATDEKETLKMLQIAYSEGIRYVFATPHFHPKRGEADSAVVDSVFENVQVVIKEKFPEFRTTGIRNGLLEAVMTNMGAI